MITEQCLVGCNNHSHHKNCNFFTVRIENNIIKARQKLLDYITAEKEYCFLHFDRDFYEIIDDKGRIKRVAKFYFY